MLGFAIFLAVFFAFFGVSVWYLGLRLITPLALASTANTWMWVLLVGAALLSIVGMFAFQMERHAINSAELLITLQEVAYLLMGWLSSLLTLVVVWDLARLIAPKWIAPGMAASLSLVFLSLVMTLIGWIICMKPKASEVKIALPGLHRDLNGFKIAIISDLHVGPWFRGDFVQRVVDRTNATKPDLIAVVGDLADGLPSHLAEDIAPLRELKAPQGVIFVTGNHEYYWDVDAWLATVSGLGFRILMNQVEIVTRGEGELTIAGVPDPQAKDFPPSQVRDISAVEKSLPANRGPRILFSHNPNGAARAAKAGFDLQISGHTHGGQFFPWTWAIHLFTRYASGLYSVSTMKLFVGRGAGAWGPPLRLGASPEIPVIILSEPN